MEMAIKQAKTAMMLPLQGTVKISPLYHGNMESNLVWLEEHGFTGMEPVISDPFTVDGKTVKKKAQEHRLGITTIVTGQTGSLDPVSLCGPNDGLRKKTIDRLKEYMKLAYEMESMVTIGLIKGSCTEDTKEKSLLRLRDSLERLLPDAERWGITLLMEPINHMKSGLLNTSAELLAFVRSYFEGAPIKILWDSFQADMEGEQAAETLELLGDFLGHVHFADSDRLFPGEGYIDFQGIMQKLSQMEYQGYITLECYNIPDRGHILEKAGRFNELYLCKLQHNAVNLSG